VNDLKRLGQLCDGVMDLLQCKEDIFAGLSFVARKCNENHGCIKNLHSQVLLMEKYRYAFPLDYLHRLLPLAHLPTLVRQA